MWRAKQNEQKSTENTLPHKNRRKLKLNRAQMRTLTPSSCTLWCSAACATLVVPQLSREDYARGHCSITKQLTDKARTM